MTELNSYYAHESTVGPVFDVAHFSTYKSLKMGLAGLVFGAVVAAAALFVWNPDLVYPNPPEWFLDANQEVKDLARDYPLGTKIGVGVAGLFAFIFAAAGLSAFTNALAGDYYVRVGEGGISLRLPDSFFTCFERDFDWSQVANLTVVQEKYIGSMSRNAGNIGGELRIRTTDGWSRTLGLDLFREDAWLIHQRINEALDTRPASLV